MQITEENLCHLPGPRQSIFLKYYTAKVGERGQIVIPRDARALFGIRPGDTLLVLGDEKNGLLVTPPDVMHDVARQIFQNLEEEENQK